MQSNLEKAIAFYRNELRNADLETVTAVTGKYRVLERLRGGAEALRQGGAVNIGILGDSVSHGCFAPPSPRDYDAVYHNRLRLMLQQKFPDPPINILNCAVGGVSADWGEQHFERDMARHEPELVIVCYGLNDVNNPIECYAPSLRAIFRRVRDMGADCLFLTPNMLNTYASPETESQYAEYAVKTAKMQNEGRMDSFMEAARKVCREENVPVCDAYAIWKKMAACGIDTTDLLCNRINHPCREMHLLFAELLYACITGEIYENSTNGKADEGMRQEG